MEGPVSIGIGSINIIPSTLYPTEHRKHLKIFKICKLTCFWKIPIQRSHADRLPIRATSLSLLHLSLHLLWHLLLRLLYIFCYTLLHLLVHLVTSCYILLHRCRRLAVSTRAEETKAPLLKSTSFEEHLRRRAFLLWRLSLLWKTETDYIRESESNNSNRTVRWEWPFRKFLVENFSSRTSH